PSSSVRVERVYPLRRLARLHAASLAWLHVWLQRRVAFASLLLREAPPSGTHALSRRDQSILSRERASERQLHRLRGISTLRDSPPLARSARVHLRNSVGEARCPRRRRVA